jgi:membrane associated rhomboid family serine protease
MWHTLGARGEQQMRAFSLIAMLMGIQLLWGALFGGNNAWLADFFGFAFGFVASTLLVPGGFARLLRLMRRQ